jgi:hypothetical protein
MTSSSDRKPTPPEPSTPGRPHDSSRQQKHPDQNLESGSDTLDRDSGRDPMRGGSTAQYRDRPTDDGMKGDGADEPNAGSPRMPRQSPSRRTHQKG